MKLPGRTEGAVQELVGVDPGVYAQRGQAVAGLGAAVGQVAGAIKQRRDDQDVHAGKLAGHEQRQQTAEIVSRLQNEDYISADDPALKGISDYTTRPDGSVLTSEVASQIYEARATELAEANAENMRPGKTRDLWEANQKTSIAERTAEIETRAGKIAKRERKIEDARMLGEAVDNQDWTGAMHAISMSGWSDQEKADRRAAVKVSRENSDVDNAILARDLGEIDKQLELMGMAQDEYPGELSTGARIQQRTRLESARKAISAGNAAYDKANRSVALMKLNSAKDNYLAGGETSPGQVIDSAIELAPQIGIPADVLLGKGAIDYTGMDVADAKLVYEFRQLSKDFENFELVASGTPEAVSEHMGELKTAADEGGAEEALRYQRALDYQDKMEQSKRDDPLTLADRHSITGNRVTFDVNDIGGTLGPELEASRTASEHYGVPDRIVSDATLQQIQDQWDTAGTDERLSMMAEINSQLPDTGAKHTFWADRMSTSDSGSAWVAGDMAAIGAETGDARSVSRSRSVLAGQAILDNPDNEVLLESKDWSKADRKDAELDIAPDMHRLFPLDHQARTQAVLAAATDQIMRGTAPKHAVRRAQEAVQGGPLVGSNGSSAEVRPPTPRMSEKEFNRGQQGISDDYYASVGFTREGIREDVLNGDVVFEDTGMEPGTYYLKDTRTDMYVESDPPGAVVQWDQVDDVGAQRGGISRVLHTDEEALLREEFSAEVKTRTDEAAQVRAAYRVAQREKEAKRKADQRHHRFEEKGVPFFPWQKGGRPLREDEQR